MNEDTRTALARFDDAMREKAHSSGQPVPRTAAGFPGVMSGLGYLVFRLDPAKRRLMVQQGQRAVTATAEHVSKAFRVPGSGALALDRKAATAMSALIPEEDRALALSVAAHRAAPVSGRYAELAAACSARFYAPTGMDVTSGDAWLAAFGATASEAREVADHAATPDGDGGDGILLLSLQGVIAETSTALDAALRPGASAGERVWIDRNYAFELCEALTEFTGALTAYDPLMRKRGVLAGDLVRAEVLPGTGKTSARVRLAAPVSVKQGEEVAVLPADGRSRPGPGTCCLERYIAEDDGLHALITTMPKGKGGGLDVISAAGEGVTVLVGNAKPPFMSVPRKAYTRWFGKNLSDRHPRPRKRPVPSYIVLAGGGPDVTGVPAG